MTKKDNVDLIDLEVTTETVELFGENVISTALYERDMTISPLGDEIVFTLGDYKQTKRCLVMMKKTGNTWGAQEILSFSGQYQDIEPFFSVSGDQLYFASNRPIEANEPNVTRTDYNIWVSARMDSSWSNPEPLPTNINTTNDEFYPSLSSNNNLYFTSVRDNGIGSEDIFMSEYMEGKFLDPVPLSANINTSTYEFNAYIHPDENLIIFSSYGRADDLGGGDLYYSKKDENNHWLPAINMGSSINSDKLDYCPFIDVRTGNFYFTSERRVTTETKIKNINELHEYANDILNGMGNIYRVRWDENTFK